MDEFEQLLQKNIFKKPSMLYQNVQKPPELTYKPHDVIESVHSQIKAIYLADSAKSTKSLHKDFSSVRKSDFLTVNKLPVYSEVPKQNKFETQCVSDTQLIDIIEGAEAIDTHTGMTQEFDITFAHTQDKKRNNKTLEINDKCQSSPLIANENDKTSFQKDTCIEHKYDNSSNSDQSTNTIITENEIITFQKEDILKGTIDNQVRSQTTGDEKQNKTYDISDSNFREYYYQNNKDIEVNNSIISDTILMQEINSQFVETDTENTETFTENQSSQRTRENNMNLKNIATSQENDQPEDAISSAEIHFDTGQHSQRSPSPVLNLKTIKRKSRTPSPFVVPLESFENFEHIAMSIIEDNGEIETAKYLINSQLLGRELLFNTNMDVMFADRNYSPILELKSDELQINSQNFKTSIKDILNNAVSLEKDGNSNERGSASLKDELLFSSDEENDYIHEELQDLPLTCALETSFYDEPGALEKTMYVGFQTASNKSIQVCSDSFNKAKSILDEDHDKSGKEFSLTELVEKCDILSSGFQKSTDAKTIPVTNEITPANKKTDLESKLNSIKVKNGLETGSDNLTSSQKNTGLCEKTEFNIFHNTENNKKETLNKRGFKGFMTANFKKIQLSQRSLNKCSEVFKDIDIDEKIYDAEYRAQTDSDAESKAFRDEHKINENCAKNIEESTIDDKINDEVLLKEFGNIEMHEVMCTVNDAKSINMIGFKTASNKDINISEKALAKTKIIFQDIDSSKDTDDLDKNKLSKANFVGFKTANNKHIKISKEALSKSKGIFKDIHKNIPIMETVADIDQPSTSKALFVEFKTASNKNVKVSDEAISKSKSIFKDIDIENSAMEPIRDIDQPPTSNAVLLGFETANNKDIKISNEAFSKSKNIFKDIKNKTSAMETIYKSDQKSKNNLGRNRLNVKFSDATLSKCSIDASEKEPSNYIQTSQNNAMLIGFTTANNKHIKISDQAFSRSNHIFKDIEKETSEIDIFEDFQSRKEEEKSSKEPYFEGITKSNDTHVEKADCDLFEAKNMVTHTIIKDICQPSTSKAVSVGFKTANNKEIKISDSALSKYKNIFKDIDEANSSLSEIKPNKASLHGFNTASTKKYNSSEKAITNTKQLFTSSEDNLIPKVQDHNQSYLGFKTANNESVNISAKSIQKCKKLFADLEKLNSANLDSETRSCVKNDECRTFQGFQTASKKSVTVSEDALKRSKRIFQDIDKFNYNEDVPEKIPKINHFKGFQTANSKTVEVSEEALIACKKLFNDTKFNQVEPQSFVGFKTASNKEVNISKEALAKCKKIFDDIEDTSQEETESGQNQTKKKDFKGFQTASYKKVPISVRALEKSKKIFDDIDGNIKKDNVSHCFRTASIKQASVSEKALVDSRRLFKDVFTENKKESTKAKNEITESIIPNYMFGFKSSNNKKIQVSEEALIQSKKIFTDVKTFNNTKSTSQVKLNYAEEPLETSKYNSINLDCLINTQVLNNFEENMCTEDFRDTPKPNKRSGSPILSCPRAKKRKRFETPYKSIPKTVIDIAKKDEVKKVTLFEFKENDKKNKRYTLKDLTNLEKDNEESGLPIDPNVLKFNLENILNFKFDKDRNDLNDGIMTIEELKQKFIEASDKKLIPEGWLDIQLKLILWKLISYEIKFPKTLGRVCTIRNVMNQLKFRYDKELYNAVRPILRKILEKDDVSSRTMVLCVAGIYVDGVNVISATNLQNIELLLTDGWYFVKATIDTMLSKLVYDGKITVGTKIATSGAELVGADQGVAPWEDTSSIRLHISGNSTRRARWHARLGRRAGAILCRLRDVTAGGGRAARLRARVYRIYPPLYVERCEDGGTVTRSERLELQYQMKYEADREAMMEKIYEEVEKEFEEQVSQQSASSDPTRWCESGSQIARLMKRSADPAEFRAQLTSTQAQLLSTYNSAQREAYIRAVQNRIQDKMRARNVVRILRGKVAACAPPGYTTATLSIWKPSEEVLDIFKEGAWIEVMNVVPTAVRNSEIQLSAGRQSAFRLVKSKDETFKLHFEALKRKCYTIEHLSQNPPSTPSSEIDTAGIVFTIDPPNNEFESIKNQFQNAYLADVDKNIICVNFWGGLKKFGYENVLETGQVIYCENLQKRAGNTRKNIPQYRATEYTLFTKTPKNEMGRMIVDELNKRLGIDRRKFCDDCVAVKQNYSVIRCFNDSENVTPYRLNKSDYNLIKNKIFIDTPVGEKVRKDDFNLTGLDFESTFKLDTQELSPAVLLRKRKVNEKIARLKMYGEPPPLSPINIINKSKSAANSYKSPLISNNGGNKLDTSVASVNKQDVTTPKKVHYECVGTRNLVGSPIISMNQTFVKRNANPVKLNFSESENDKSVAVDHFAEEFDGSPPLSLD